ncbi:hypothetical protein [Thiobacillus sp.]
MTETRIFHALESGKREIHMPSPMTLTEVANETGMGVALNPDFLNTGMRCDEKTL